MATITADMVKQLRDATGAKMMDCKKALTENDGDVEKAKEWLRKKQLVSAGKKADRSTSEGAVGSYIHMGGKIGVMVEMLCETDFVSRNEEFQTLLRDICMHVAAANPLYLDESEVPDEVKDKEREIAREQAKGKPESAIEKIVEGKLGKYYEQHCLLDQKFVKDDKMTVGQVVKQKIGKLGENMRITRFVRWELGETSA
mgnify:CR=1 FL=1